MWNGDIGNYVNEQTDSWIEKLVNTAMHSERGPVLETKTNLTILLFVACGKHLKNERVPYLNFTLFFNLTFVREMLGQEDRKVLIQTAFLTIISPLEIYKTQSMS